jgi:putative transposase
MKMFIDEHREAYGVEPICRVLPIAPSTYRAHAARVADPTKRSDRAKRDAELRPEIWRVWDENFEVYGVRKIWRQLKREGVEVARCTVARLMADMGLSGAVRGRAVKTTISSPSAPCPEDRVSRQFHAPAPNRLWLSDFTYVATWTGFVHVAFAHSLGPVALIRSLIDAFARRIVGWRVSRSMQARFVLDALEQALHGRQPLRNTHLVHHSDRGVQYVSIRYTERLVEAGIEPSVGSVGDSYDNALAETVIGLFKTKVIHRRGPWRSLEAVEFATLVRQCRSDHWRDLAHGRLVQQPPTARAHRQHPARRSRGPLPCAERRARYGGVTQTNQPPEKAGRFRNSRRPNGGKTTSTMLPRGAQTRTPPRRAAHKRLTMRGNLVAGAGFEPAAFRL